MKPESVLDVEFYETDAGNQPVRKWISALPREERGIIGMDIFSIQIGWPIGKPLGHLPMN